MYAITVRPTDQTDAKGRHRPGPENMEWTQVPTPTPASGEVRVAVKAVGMNRADLLQRQGLYPPPPGVSETMGLEVCGTIDALGDKQFRGRIQQISPATGSEFAVLQTQNATGNFTKVPQRIAVRIRVDPGQRLSSRLRPGMSVEARVDTRSAASATR